MQSSSSSAGGNGKVTMNEQEDIGEDQDESLMTEEDGQRQADQHQMSTEDPMEEQQGEDGQQRPQTVPSASAYAQPLIAPRVTEHQIQMLRTGGSVRPGSSLADFYKDLEQYQPVIPDSVALYYMRKNGINNPDPRVVRLFSLASQKFISDICLDAMQQARIKGLGQVRKGTRDAKYCLTMDLLAPVLEEYGIPMDKPPYYT